MGRLVMPVLGLLVLAEDLTEPERRALARSGLLSTGWD